jgi:hypothetical protein
MAEEGDLPILLLPNARQQGNGKQTHSLPGNAEIEAALREFQESLCTRYATAAAIATA